MTKFSAILTACIAALALSAPLVATAANADCEAKAIGKNGKPLAGAAKASYMKKCEAGSGAAAACEATAMDKNGKALAGAAKSSYMKKCEADAGAKK